MIPSVVARQVRETILDYLRTTFSLADPAFDRALVDFLESEGGLFKGPYVDVRLPFRKAAEGERIPLDIQPDFEPYKHQLKAFQRLYSRDGHQPQHTLVTTGTGSGKTECFLYPVLDHCWRQREAPGVKAILLYPMNALASDQARRLAQTRCSTSCCCAPRIAACGSTTDPRPCATWCSTSSTPTTAPRAATSRA